MSWWCVWAQVKALVKKNIFWRSWLLVVGFYTEAKFQVMTWCKVSRLSRLVVEGPFPTSLSPFCIDALGSDQFTTSFSLCLSSLYGLNPTSFDPVTPIKRVGWVAGVKWKHVKLAETVAHLPMKVKVKADWNGQVKPFHKPWPFLCWCWCWCSLLRCWFQLSSS